MHHFVKIIWTYPFIQGSVKDLVLKCIVKHLNSCHAFGLLFLAFANDVMCLNLTMEGQCLAIEYICFTGSGLEN